MGFFSKIKDQNFFVGLVFYVLCFFFFFFFWGLKLNSTGLSGCSNVYSRGFKTIFYFKNIKYIIFSFWVRGFIWAPWLQRSTTPIYNKLTCHVRSGPISIWGTSAWSRSSTRPGSINRLSSIVWQWVQVSRELHQSREMGPIWSGIYPRGTHKHKKPPPHHDNPTKGSL